MSIFKAAIRVLMRRPTYLLIYAVWLSAMGVFLTSTIITSDQQNTFESYTADIAVIDRDNSELSHALTSHLAERGELINVEDNALAMQDAVATGLVECLFVVPEGFGDAYLEAARTGTDAPIIQSTYSYQSMAGSLFDQHANRYLALVSAAAALDEHASMDSLITQANEASQENAAVDAVATADAMAPADQFAFYLQWSTYTLTAAIVVCVGMLMNSFNRTDIRRRNNSSPISTLSYGLQLALGCLCLTIFVWAFSIGLGLVAFGSSLAEVSPGAIALTLMCSFAFALVPLGIGFLLGQLGAGESIANATGNVIGMVMAFLGGAWISLDLLAPEVQMVAHFTPAYWYCDAIHQTLHLETLSWEAIAPILGNTAIVLLFAAVLFAVALVAGKLRASSSEAGGNAAAARA